MFPLGTAKGICDFYPQILGTPAQFHNGDSTIARVEIGQRTNICCFRETDPGAGRDYDGHHVADLRLGFSRARTAGSQILGTPAQFHNGDSTIARVEIGKDQYLLFRETDRGAAGL